MPRVGVFLLLLLYQLVQDVASTALVCPVECTCTQKEASVASDCSSASLACLPANLDNLTTVLDLSNNIISTLPANMFTKWGVHLLQLINLKNNELTDVHALAFRGLHNLSALYLQGNSIKYLDPVTFMGNPKLKILDISTNEFSILPNVSSETLQTLYLQYNDIMAIDFCSLFSKFPNLIDLDLSMNRISHISDSAECNDGIPHSSLKKLDLSNNKISEIHEILFQRFTNLALLNLSHNALKFTKDMPNFKNMSKLVTLDLSFNRIRFLHRYIVQYNYELEYVILHSNNILFLHKDTFKTLYRLRILEMQRNDLTHIHKDTLKNNQYLQEVNFGHNGISVLANDTFSGNPILVRLNLCGCESCSKGIKDITAGTFSDKNNLMDLDLSKHKIGQLDSETFSDNPSLEILYLNDNRLQSLPEGIFKTNLRLYSLNIRNNLIQTLKPNTFTRNTELRSIDISSNLITTLDPNIFFNNRFLKKLTLSHNKLIFGNSILNSESLEVLDLSFCNIKSLPTESFVNTPNLKKLLLNNNRLEYIKKSVFDAVQHPEHIENEELQAERPLRNLQFLDISHNLMEVIDMDVLCDRIHLIELHIDGNPLICDCALRNAWQWIHEHHLETTATCKNSGQDWAIVRSLNCSDNKNYSCSKSEGRSQSPAPDQEEFEPRLAEHTFSYVITYALLCLIIFLVIVGWTFPLMWQKGQSPKNDDTIDGKNTYQYHEFLLYPQLCEK